MVVTLKSCDPQVQPNVSFLLLPIVYTLKNEMVLICEDGLAENQRIPQAFCQGKQSNAIFRVGPQKRVIPAALSKREIVILH